MTESDTGMTDKNCAQSWPEHDCFAWQRQHYHMTPDYVSAECGTCRRITGFRWRKIWPRIRSLFTSNPLRSTVEKY